MLTDPAARALAIAAIVVVLQVVVVKVALHRTERLLERIAKASEAVADGRVGKWRGR